MTTNATNTKTNHIDHTKFFFPEPQNISPNHEKVRKDVELIDACFRMTRDILLLQRKYLEIRKSALSGLSPDEQQLLEVFGLEKLPTVSIDTVPSDDEEEKKFHCTGISRSFSPCKKTYTETEGFACGTCGKVTHTGDNDILGIDECNMDCERCDQGKCVPCFCFWKNETETVSFVNTERDSKGRRFSDEFKSVFDCKKCKKEFFNEFIDCDVCAKCIKEILDKNPLRQELCIQHGGTFVLPKKPDDDDGKNEPSETSSPSKKMKIENEEKKKSEDNCSNSTEKSNDEEK